MKRHLLVTNDFPPKVGGIQSYLWELWSRLDPDSFEVLTATSHPDASEFDAEQARHGFRIQRIPGKTLYVPTAGSVRRVATMAKEMGAGLVVIDPAVPLGVMGPFVGVPFAVVLHGAEVTVPARIPVSRTVLSQVLGHARLVISAGGYPAAEGARIAGRRMPAVVEIPPGVDCERFAPLDEPARAAARRRLGLPESGLLVASVSRLVPRKGMDVLIEAVRRLRTSFPDLTLAIAGGGRQEGELAEQVRRSGAGILLGRIGEPEKAMLLGAADVFAMACRTRWLGLEQEGFGIVFMEAAASGVPQVAGTSGGAAEAVEDGETGVVVRRPGDPGAVAEALRKLLVDPALRRRMGVAARRRAVGSFDYARLAPRLAEALSEYGA